MTHSLGNAWLKRILNKPVEAGRLMTKTPPAPGNCIKLLIIRPRFQILVQYRLVRLNGFGKD
jgi:hypothetical protein